MCLPPFFLFLARFLLCFLVFVCLLSFTLHPFASFSPPSPRLASAGARCRARGVTLLFAHSCPRSLLRRSVSSSRPLLRYSDNVTLFTSREVTRNRERQRAPQYFLLGEARVFIVHAEGTHSRNASETQHGRLAQDESGVPCRAGVHTTTAACSLGLLSSVQPLRSPFLSAFSRRAFKEYTLALCPPPSCTYAYRRVAICLRFCTMLLLSLRRFLAFCLHAFPSQARSYLSVLFASPSHARPAHPSSSVSPRPLSPFSLSFPFSHGFCISLSFLSPDRAFHSKIERQRACRAHFSS